MVTLTSLYVLGEALPDVQRYTNGGLLLIDDQVLGANRERMSGMSGCVWCNQRMPNPAWSVR